MPHFSLAAFFYLNRNAIGWGPKGEDGKGRVAIIYLTVKTQTLQVLYAC